MIQCIIFSDHDITVMQAHCNENLWSNVEILLHYQYHTFLNLFNDSLQYCNETHITYFVLQYLMVNYTAKLSLSCVGGR